MAALDEQRNVPLDVLRGHRGRSQGLSAALTPWSWRCSDPISGVGPVYPWKGGEALAAASVHTPTER
jgi:hypothetical protein